MELKSPSAFAKTVFPFLTLTITISLVTSCGILKSENPCTLRAEQLPEVRGLRLGMTLQDLERKFPLICRPTAETFSDDDLKLWATVRTGVLSQNRKDCSPISSQTASTSFSIDLSQNPEFAGVSDVTLTFVKNYLASIEIAYEHTRDEQFKTAFHLKTAASLGLDKWTNWKLSVLSIPKQDNGVSFTISKLTQTLECDKASVITEIQEYAMPVGNTYFPNLKLNADVKAVEIEKKREEFDKEKDRYKANSEHFTP